MAQISTNRILKMIAAASSFLTCKPMRSLFTQTCQQTSSYLKYLMNSCIWHSEPKILRLLHYIVILLIAKILHNYEFELEILILIVFSYCGVSNMVSRRPSF